MAAVMLDHGGDADRETVHIPFKKVRIHRPDTSQEWIMRIQPGAANAYSLL